MNEPIYEGLVALTIGEDVPYRLWARIHLDDPEPEIEITGTPPTRITASPRIRCRVETGPERPDLPDDRQPPTWPPPFPLSASALEPQPYCLVAIEYADHVAYLDNLRLEIDLQNDRDRGLSWKATLTQ